MIVVGFMRHTHTSHHDHELPGRGPAPASGLGHPGPRLVKNPYRPDHKPVGRTARDDGADTRNQQAQRLRWGDRGRRQPTYPGTGTEVSRVDPLIE
jgi:hypothetical protein